MKRVIFFLLLFGLVVSKAQVTIWYEDFGTGCSQGNTASTFFSPNSGNWFVTSSPNLPVEGSQKNDWFVSATEAGQQSGFCSEGCISTPSLSNRCLHIGSTLPLPKLDSGAFYSINQNSTTNRIAFPSFLNCSNYSNINLSFVYFAKYVQDSDYAEVMYFTGGPWISLGQLNTSTCSPNTGMWTNYSVSLPANANNNSNVGIGFRWQNYGKSIPSSSVSVAIDNIRVSGSIINSTEELTSVTKITLYPNPANDFVNFSSENQVAHLEVINNVGVVVKKKNFDENEQTLFVSDLPTGIYAVNFKDENGLHYVRRLAIVR